MNDILSHSGIKRRSGRYPYGSGEIPFQHEPWFTWGKNPLLNKVRDLEDSGYSRTEIAHKLGYSTTEFRKIYGNAVEEERMQKIAAIQQLSDSGYSTSEIAFRTGISPQTQRYMLKSYESGRRNQAQQTADFLRKQVDEKKVIDIGKGVELELNVSELKFKQAVKMLEEEGYEVKQGRIDQVTDPNGKQKTTSRVLCVPGSPKNAAYDIDNIKTITDYKAVKDLEGKDIFVKGFQYPESLDSKRLEIGYSPEKDGLVEIRRGVKDLDLGKSTYAQVRILVDGTHYIKGMAVYADDLPDGIDIRFNTGKSRSAPVKGKVLKPISEDPLNPFGALIKDDGQYYWTDKNGKEHLGLINKHKEAGDWHEWSDTLSSQFLSKQSIKLISQQLNLSVADKKAELEEIMSLTNPSVKKRLLISFADDCDTTAVHLTAAAIPRQKYQVLLPMNDLKDGEIFAPNYKNGERLALVRFPHGGIFEIPILTVNNKLEQGKKMIGNSGIIDAVGINAKAAQQLSGADFDGDTALVLPLSDKIDIKSHPYLKELAEFDPHTQYAYHEGMKTISEKHKEIAMGEVTNLIMDMTLFGASPEETARAVKHSMVVIDAYKHNLDYQQSAIDNGIAELQKKWQGYTDDEGKYHRKGAGTIVTRAKKDVDVPRGIGTAKIDPVTGKKYYNNYRTYTDSSGKEHTVTEKQAWMLTVDDAYDLVSKKATPEELAYADYANTMKSLAGEARKTAYYGLDYEKRDPEMAKLYADEVASLTSKLEESNRNAPKEREAQRIANVEADKRISAFTEITAKDAGKIRQQALTSARASVGAERFEINITPNEWEAIQNNAISKTLLESILTRANPDQVRQYATPKSSNTLSDGKRAKLEAMLASGYTNEEIADSLGISLSALINYLKEK